MKELIFALFFLISLFNLSSAHAEYSCRVLFKKARARASTSITPVQQIQEEASPSRRVGRAKSHSLGLSFSQAARANGLRFVMRVVPFYMVAPMLRQMKTANQDFNLNSLPGLINNIYGYDTSLIPLFDLDHGHYIQHTIASSSKRAHGYEYVELNEWFVGFIFPVEILDRIFFHFYAKTNQHVIGSPEEMYSKDVTPDFFGNVLKWVLDHPKWPGSHFTTSGFRIVPVEKAKIPLNQAVLSWIPAPLLKGQGSFGAEFPGSKDTELPESAEKPFLVQIAVRDPNHPKANVEGWAPVAPVGPDFTTPWFDPSNKIGTWYRGMPDWQLVEKILAESAQNNQTPSLTDGRKEERGLQKK